jgi:hypothetical protein
MKKEKDEKLETFKTLVDQIGEKGQWVAKVKFQHQQKEITTLIDNKEQMDEKFIALCGQHWNKDNKKKKKQCTTLFMACLIAEKFPSTSERNWNQNGYTGKKQQLVMDYYKQDNYEWENAKQHFDKVLENIANIQTINAEFKLP